MTRSLAIAAAVAGALGLSACATAQGPYAYSGYEAGGMARVEEGTVVSARPIVFNPQQQNQGALVGGAAGAAVGSQFGGDTGGHLLGAVIGGLLGVAAGTAIEGDQAQRGFAYTVRREYDGSMVEIAQVEPQPLPVGARVRIVYGDRIRLVPAY